MTGASPIGASGLGTFSEYSRKRKPMPPQKITTFITCLLGITGQSCGTARCEGSSPRQCCMIYKQRQTFHPQAPEPVAPAPLWLSFSIRALTPIRDSGVPVAGLPNRAASYYVMAQGRRLKTVGFG